MTWTTIFTPGAFATKKTEIFQKYNHTYGEDNWRIMHEYKGKVITFLETCKLFEESYFQDSKKRIDLWESLRKTAREVYDIDESDIKSGLNYLVQQSAVTHIQDIAIRNVFRRKDWDFQGKELVQIRGRTGYFGNKLTPYRVSFHEPEFIPKIELAGMWFEGSVEEFYQKTKVLQIRK